MREFLSNYQKEKARAIPNEKLFSDVIDLIHGEIGDNAFKVKRAVNKSVCDAVMVSIAQIMEEGKSVKDLKQMHERLIQDKEFIKYVTSGTSTESHVNGRITVARNYFLGFR